MKHSICEIAQNFSDPKGGLEQGMGGGKPQDTADREVGQGALSWQPKTKREARRAAAALFGEKNDHFHNRKSVTMLRQKPEATRNPMKPLSTLFPYKKQGRLQLSAQPVHSAISKNISRSDAFKKSIFGGGIKQGRRPIAANTHGTRFHGDLRRHLLKELRGLQQRERDFLYLEIADSCKNGDCGVISFFISSQIASIRKEIKPLTIITFFKEKRQLIHEHPAVQQFSDMGWPTVRECVESMGHAVERLQERLKQHGWQQSFSLGKNHLIGGSSTANQHSRRRTIKK